MKKHSQIGQDLAVLEFYKNKKGGFFVDIGAHNGVDISNSYLLEKNFRWKGICVEPHPNFYKKLIKSRAAECVQVAAYSEDDLEFEFASAGVLSGIIDHLDFHKSAKNNPTFKVKTKTLTSILDEHSAPSFIEYLSIDTEGSELEVLKGIDFDKYTFGFMSIEHNWVEPRREQMKEFLTDRDYEFYFEKKHDDFFIHKSLK